MADPQLMYDYLRPSSSPLEAKLRARIAALEADLAAARKDAERYRRIRSHTADDALYQPNFSGLMMQGEKLDKAVDDLLDAALGKGEAG